MQRVATAALMLSVLLRSTCHGSDDPKPARPTANGPTADPRPPTLEVPVVPTALAVPPPFEVVDVVDFRRHEVRSFALGKLTRELFVSFGDRSKTERDAVYQWNLAGSPALVATYRVDQGWFVFNVFVSPDGRRVLARLEPHDRSMPLENQVRYLLIDAEKHAVLSADLGVVETGYPEVQFGASGQRLRITLQPYSSDGKPKELVYDAEGHPATADPSEFPAPKKGRVWVIQSAKGMAVFTHGLYYTDDDGQDYRVEPDPWHGGYDITRDGRYLVTTTWSGEIRAFSTSARAIVFKQKIANQHSHLAYDEKADRFLIGDATHDGTTKLRALVRRGAL